MNDAMPRQRPPYLWRQRTRHGAIAWYVCRERAGKRIRIKGEYGSPDFMAAYNAALNGLQVSPRGTKAGSLAWLIERYRETTDWNGFSQATRRQRDTVFKQVIKTAGNDRYTAITAATITA